MFVVGICKMCMHVKARRQPWISSTYTHTPGTYEHAQVGVFVPLGSENGTLVLTHTQQSLCQVPLSPVLQVSISFGCFEPKLNCTNLVIHFLFSMHAGLSKGEKMVDICCLGYHEDSPGLFLHQRASRKRTESRAHQLLPWPAPPLCASSGIHEA